MNSEHEFDDSFLAENRKDSMVSVTPQDFSHHEEDLAFSKNLEVEVSPQTSKFFSKLKLAAVVHNLSYVTLLVFAGFMSNHIAIIWTSHLTYALYCVCSFLLELYLVYSFKTLDKKNDDLREETVSKLKEDFKEVVLENPQVTSPQFKSLLLSFILGQVARFDAYLDFCFIGISFEETRFDYLWLISLAAFGMFFALSQGILLYKYFWESRSSLEKTSLVGCMMEFGALSLESSKSELKSKLNVTYEGENTLMVKSIFLESENYAIFVYRFLKWIGSSAVQLILQTYYLGTFGVSSTVIVSTLFSSLMLICGISQTYISEKYN